MTKILTIVGARPQFIKAAVVSRAIANHNQSSESRQSIQEVIIHSGQHYDINMSDIFFHEMGIPKPNHRLDLTKATHGAMTGEILTGVEEIIMAEKPEIVLVYGDTNTTLAGALAAVKLHIPVAHVEAGLRSFNMRMPEEINRIVTDRISHWLFCPTQTAVDNLANEGFAVSIRNNNAPIVANVGDVMYDAARYYEAQAEPPKALGEFSREPGPGFYLATVHRAENTDDPQRLADIISALDEISARVPTVLPLHPRTRKLLQANKIQPARIKIIDPVGYFEVIWLLKNCKGVFTDSGGLQKEAYYFAKPCVTLRDETEWTELVAGGYNTLTGANVAEILKAENHMKTTIGQTTTLYGDGHAGEKIVRLLTEYCR